MIKLGKWRVVMAKIYVTDRKCSNEVKIFSVDHEYQADLIFFEVNYQNQAKGDELWYFVDYQNEADTTVRWVDHDYDADLKVYKARHQYQAKWKKSHKLRNRIG